MQPAVIVEGYSVHHRLPCLLTGGEFLPMHAGRFQSPPEALGRCVVPTVALRAHGRTHAPALERILEFCAAIQYVSIRYTERLEEAGLMPSVGSTGDSYDNALAETINGLYKTEVIYKRGPWKTRESLELATLQWVHWFNHDRLLESIGHIPPAEAEANYWRQVANTVQASACTSTN